MVDIIKYDIIGNHRNILYDIEIHMLVCVFKVVQYLSMNTRCHGKCKYDAYTHASLLCELENVW